MGKTVMTDIVKRLRYMARQYTNGERARGGAPGTHYLDEAADEIERLRADIQLWQRGNNSALNTVNRLGIESERLRADKAALVEELGIALLHCCNSYWGEGHAQRVCARFGIADPTVKGH